MLNKLSKISNLIFQCLQVTFYSALVCVVHVVQGFHVPAFVILLVGLPTGALDKLPSFIFNILSHIFPLVLG